MGGIVRGSFVEPAQRSAAGSTKRPAGPHRHGHAACSPPGHDWKRRASDRGRCLVGAALAAEARRARQAVDLDGPRRARHRRLPRTRPADRPRARRTGRHASCCSRATRPSSNAPSAGCAPKGIEVSRSSCRTSRDAADAERAVETVVSRHGAIDVLVNNAGIITVGPLEHATRRGLRGVDGRALLGAAAHHAGGDPAHAPSGRRPHRQHLFDRRQGRRAAPGALLRRQVRAHRPLERGDARAGARQHRGHDRLSRTHADRLALQRVVQGAASPGVRVVRHRRLAAAALDERTPRRGADRRRDAPRRRRARHHVGGAARRCWPARRCRTPWRWRCRPPAACCQGRPDPKGISGAAAGRARPTGRPRR